MRLKDFTWPCTSYSNTSLAPLEARMENHLASVRVASRTGSHHPCWPWFDQDSCCKASQLRISNDFKVSVRPTSNIIQPSLWLFKMRRHQLDSRHVHRCKLGAELCLSRKSRDGAVGTKKHLCFSPWTLHNHSTPAPLFTKKKRPKMWFNDREGERGIENHGNSAGIMSTANSTDAIHAWRSLFV